MSYRLALDRDDHRDLASGSVLRSAPGYPAFPVRLADELFGRAASHLPAGRPVALWDPCCGSGYLATVVGVLHRDRLRSIRYTDVDPGAVELAERNASLLTTAGLAHRHDELAARAAEFGKASHAEAAEAAGRLARRLRADGGDLPTRVAVADVFNPPSLLDDPPDLVLTDVPYGRQTAWNNAPGEDPIGDLVRALTRVLADDAVIALCARARRISVGGARALERVRLGTRAAFIGRVGELRDAL